jgi:hypothetical protein
VGSPKRLNLTSQHLEIHLLSLNLQVTLPDRRHRTDGFESRTSCEAVVESKGAFGAISRVAGRVLFQTNWCWRQPLLTRVVSRRGFNYSSNSASPGRKNTVSNRQHLVTETTHELDIQSDSLRLLYWASTMMSRKIRTWKRLRHDQFA